MAFGTRLNQQIVTAADFNPDLLNDPEHIEDFATRVEVRQPLLNFDGFSKRKAARAQWEAASFNSERTREYMLLEVEQAYMQLQLAYKAVEVLKKAKQTALENLKQARDQFEQGILQKSDVLAVEVRVTEITNQVQQAISNVENASNYLSVLMTTPIFPFLNQQTLLQFSVRMGRPRPFLKAERISLLLKRRRGPISSNTRLIK